jgi:hypothetical protein
MPSELTIKPVQTAQAASETTAEPKAAPFPSPHPSHPAPAGQPYTNPNLHLDASLGLVVIEFRDDAGAITSSIPSQRQIDAYRMHQEALPGSQDANSAGSTADRQAEPGIPAPVPRV